MLDRHNSRLHTRQLLGLTLVMIGVAAVSVGWWNSGGIYRSLSMVRHSGMALEKRKSKGKWQKVNGKNQPAISIQQSVISAPAPSPQPPAPTLHHSSFISHRLSSPVPSPQPLAHAFLVTRHSSLVTAPLRFEANEGQTDRQVQFLSRGRGYTLFLTTNEAVLALQRIKTKSKGKRQKAKGKNEEAKDLTASGNPSPNPEPSIENPKSKIQNRQPLAPAVVRMKLEGANPAPQVSGLGELPGRSNYFIGNDPEKWRTNVPNYVKVQYKDVYRGVDLVYYGNQGQLEYDFVVAPGADPNSIKLSFQGAKGIHVDKESGDLVLNSSGSALRFHKPVVYQPEESQKSKVKSQKSKVEEPLIDGHSVLRASKLATRNSKLAVPKSKIGNPKSEITVGFEVAGYDPNKPLVIDPVLAYSTYLGGSDFDAGTSIAVDSTGNAYVTGETASTDFPTMFPYQANNAGNSDVFVTKLDPSGTTRVYSTYLGGSLSERGTSIAVDSFGNAYITGRTNSDDFPMMNAFQADLLGDYDAFVVKLNADGNALLYSTYFGGGGNDAGLGIAVDAWGDAYVTGGASVLSMDDFPTTTGAFQRVFGGGMNDAFVAKFDPSRAGPASLVYSTFLGGGDIERGNSIAVDSAGNAYLTGRTRSTDFPTRNPLQMAYGGGSYDAFVAKLNDTGTDLIYSTFLGGSELDQGYGIAVDSAGNVYVTGETASLDLPITPESAFQPTFGGGLNDAFVAMIDSTGGVLVYSTYLGGSDVDLGSGIAVDASGNAYVTGATTSTDFPTANPLQPANGGGLDAFVARIDPSQQGSVSLVYSTYLGGSGAENPPFQGAGGNPVGAIAVDASGNTYVTGGTTSTDFPTANPLQPDNGGGTDAFVAMIAATGALPDYALTATASSPTIVPGDSASYRITVTPARGFTGDVSFSTSGLPDNASVSFNPPLVAITDPSPQSSRMTVTTSVSTPLGIYPLTVTGTSGNLQHDASVSLIVADPASANVSISKTGSPNPVEVGTNLTYSVNVTQGAIYEIESSSH